MVRGSELDVVYVQLFALGGDRVGVSGLQGVEVPTADELAKSFDDRSPRSGRSSFGLHPSAA